jgi:1-deoxy-D-xylulose-5-phosphate reductoisomerase
VEAFRGGRLPFLGIVDTIARVVSEHQAPSNVTLEEVLAADDWARRRARELT